MNVASINPRSKSRAQQWVLNSFASFLMLTGVAILLSALSSLLLDVEVSAAWSCCCCCSVSAWYAQIYSRACFENFLMWSAVKTSIDRHLLSVSLNLCFVLFCFIESHQKKIFAQPQEYSIPSPTNLQWHFGVGSTEILIFCPMDCRRDSSSSKSV